MFERYNDVVTVEELCRMLHIGKNKAYELLQDGSIMSIRVGRVHRIPKQSIIQYVTQAETGNLRRSDGAVHTVIGAVNGKEEL